MTAKRRSSKNHDEQPQDDTHESEVGAGSPSFSVPVLEIQTILTKLPLRSLLRFRSVCKEWKNRISSPHFLGSCSATSSSYFLSHYNRTLGFFDPDQSKWVPLVPPFQLPSGDVGNKIQCLDSCSGLLCLLITQGSRTVIRVWNIVTDSWRNLPSPGRANRNAVMNTGKQNFGPLLPRLYLSSDQANFFVLLANFTGDAVGGVTSFRASVYDSSTNIWSSSHSTVATPPGRLLMSPTGNLIKDLVFWNGKLVTHMIYNDRELHAADNSVLWLYAHEQDRGRWEEVCQMDSPPMDLLKHGRLMQCAGRLVMAGKVEMEVEVWEANWESKDWKLRDRMPTEAARMFIRLGELNCMAGDDLIYFAKLEGPVMVYSMEDRNWRWIPERFEGMPRYRCSFDGILHISLHTLPV